MTVTSKPNWLLIIGTPALVFLSCIVISFSSKFRLHPEQLSIAITLDMLVTAPLLYFLLIRNSAISKMTVLRVFIVGILLAGMIFNNQSNLFLHIVKVWISPVIECVVICMVLRKFYYANREYKANAGKGKNATYYIDFFSHCRTVLKEVTGGEKAGNILSSEVAVFYYAFFSKKTKQADNSSSFQSYKKNGVLLLLVTFLCLFLIETAAMHFLIRIWSTKAAWILTTLSFYTCLQLFAHIKAVKARPVTIDGHLLQLRNGLAGDATVLISNIEKIELTGKMVPGKLVVKLGLTKTLEEHNVALYLKQPVLVTRFFGIQKKALVILFFVEHPQAFFSAANGALNNNHC